jgi:hypothetical protein
MKKIIVVVLLTTLVSACGGGGSGSGTHNDLSANTETSSNTPPISDAGQNQNISTFSEVTLNGSSSSDADGNSLSYKWSFISKPLNSNATLDYPAISAPSFTVDLEGNYTIQLIVNDGITNSIANDVMITMSLGTKTEVISPPAIGEVVTAAVNPINPRIMLISTKPGYVGETGTGIFRTIDAGLNWSLVSEGNYPKIMKYSESDPSIIFTTDSISESVNNTNTYGYSLNGGLTWNWGDINEPTFGGIIEAKTISIDSSNSAEWWLVSHNAIGGGFYRSLNNGTTWSLVFTGPFFRSNVAQSKSDPDTVFFISGVDSSEITEAIMKSTDNGNSSFSAMQGMAVDSVGRFGQFLLIDSENNDVLVTDNHFSVNGGTNWTYQTRLQPSHMVLENGVWFSLFSDSIKKSIDYGQSWEIIVSGIDNYSLSSTPGDSSFFTKLNDNFFIFSNGNLHKISTLQRSQ